MLSHYQFLFMGEGVVTARLSYTTRGFPVHDIWLYHVLMVGDRDDGNWVCDAKFASTAVAAFQ